MGHPATPILLEGRNLTKTFLVGDQSTPILRDVSIELRAQESVAIMGSSGSGKSTLLQVLGTLDRAEQGQLLFKGEELTRASDRELSLFRRRSLSFIFQAFHLLPHLTALENVQWPLVIAGQRGSKVRGQALALLESVGLAHRAHHLPSQLSGGEMQRVAIARALSNSAEVILADEPTGNLDSSNGQQVLDLLLERVRQRGASLLMVTHDPTLAQKCDRVIRLKDGTIA